MTMVQPSAFGALLRRYRLAASLTQEALAERANVSVRAISDLERGAKQRPHRVTVQLLAGALRLSPGDRAAWEAARGQDADAAQGLPLEMQSWTAAVLPPFVGRGRELALIKRHLHGEGPPLLIVSGEPGIGKSRLLYEAAQHVKEHGLRVLYGDCQRYGGQEPYAPLPHALDGHIRTQTSAQLRASLRGCAWLARLLPGLATAPIESLPAWPVPPEQERRLLFGAIARYLANVAGPGGTLLLLDDLQWADEDALDMLASLARSGQTALRVIGAYRDTEVSAHAPLSIALADLAHAGLVARCDLEPLSAPDAARLLDALLTGVATAPAPRTRVLRRTGGVPFFLVSYAQWLRDRASRSDAEQNSATNGIPWDVAQGIRQRVAALPDVTQQILSIAAVVGRRVAHTLLSQVTGRAEEDVLAALEAACQARLLVEEDSESYVFAHDLVREVIEADLGAPRRAMLHRHIARVLEHIPGDRSAAVLAYHYGHGGQQDKAALYGEEAGDSARVQYAHATAAVYYQEVVERMERLGRALDRARVQAKLGAELALLSRYEAALIVLKQAAETYRAAGDLQNLAGVMAQIGRAHSDRGTPREGLELLQPLLAILRATAPSPSLAALYAAMAHLYFVNGCYEQTLAAAENATMVARAVGDDGILPEVQMRRATALINVGHVEEALDILERVIAMAEAAGNLAVLSHGLMVVGGFKYQYRGVFDTATRYMERALIVARRLGNPAQIAFGTAGHAFLAFLAGDWSRARLELNHALALGREIGAYWRGMYPLIYLGYLDLAEGMWSAAVEHLEEGIVQAQRCGELQAVRFGQTALAEHDVLAGHPDAAYARLIPLLEGGTAEEWYVTVMLPVLAWALLDLGRVDEAATVATQAIRRADAVTNRLTRLDVLRVHALIMMRKEWWADAARTLDEALSLAHEVGDPYRHARLLHVCGEMHVRKGESAPARRQLESALAIFQRLGARKDTERTEQAIAGLPRVTAC